ncbi:tRNA (adenosine(37)-N6)-dimethylallyltransferase MiaA [bacterium]|nr:tRNA (adenosine(37)-N6)-dimethylallyltransferase MiaA [bacterium]
MKKILTIIGPTAVGKTNISIKIAKLIKGQVVGLDSRQIYKGMSIGTAQPNKIEMQSIVHHLIGERDPWKSISAGEYSKMVIKSVNSITNAGGSPIICGGAGLYYRAINKGIFKKSSSNKYIRKDLELRYDKNPNKLHNELKKIDPDYFKIVHLSNKKRLVRALEIYQITGKAPSANFKSQRIENTNKLNLFTVFLTIEKDPHLNNIRERTIKMLDNGWIDEVKSLITLKEEMEIDFPALDSIGYKQIIEYLNGSINKDLLIETIVSKTWQYAKKQYKWFKKENIDLIVDITNLDPSVVSDCIYDTYKSIN